MSDFPKLFIPGPTYVSEDILDSLSTPQIGHRTPEISELIDYLVKGGDTFQKEGTLEGMENVFGIDAVKAFEEVVSINPDYAAALFRL